MTAFSKKICSVYILSLIWVAVIAQNEQVAFLPDMFELTEVQRAEAQVLEEYSESFNLAKLYKRQDDYFIVISYQNEELEWTEGLPISADDLEALRESLQKSSIRFQDQKLENNSTDGRAYLIGSTTLHAIVQSRIVSNLFNRDFTESGSFGTRTYNDRTGFGKAFPYIASIGTLSGSIWVYYKKQVPSSAANLHFWGSLFGYGHGYFLTSLFQEPYSLGDNKNFESIMLVGTSVLEGWAGYHIAKRHNFSFNQSKAINVGNFWGSTTGLMSYGVFSRDTEFHSNTFGIYGLMGSGIGLFTSNYLYKKFPRSSGDLSAINMAGLVGSSWGTSIALVFDLTGRDAYSSLLLGTLGGLTIAGFSTKNTNFSSLEGGKINIGTIAGGAFGVLGAFLLNGDFLFLASSVSIGATAGLLLSPILFSKNIKGNKSSFIGDKIRWNVNPASIGMILSSPDHQADLMRQNIRMDMISFSYAF